MGPAGTAETAATGKTAGKTEYRVLQRLTEDKLTVDALADDAEVYLLLPDTYTGNVKRAVYDTEGEGEYVKVAARSLDRFVARKKEVVTFK